MPSRRARDALPVLTLLKDFSRALIAFSMLSFNSSKTISFMRSPSHDGPHVFSADHPPDVPRLVEIENDQGEPVIPAHGYGSCIHYFKIIRQYVGITDFFIHNRIRML